jgi:nitrate reductase (NAD(P)H)
MMRLRDPATREAIIRSYTPYSDGSDCGQLDILIKIYYDAPKRKGGAMTQALDSLPIGHWVDFKGPVGKFVYHGNGLCIINGRERRVRRFIMVCGGSGITPIRQVLRAVMQDPNDTTPCIVFNGNRSLQDILCKEELDGLEAANLSRCRIVNALTNPPPDWNGIEGFVNQALVPEQMVVPKPSGEGDELVLVCGPPPMVKSAEATFIGLGFKPDDLVFF